MKRICSKCSRPWGVSNKNKDGKYICPYCNKKRPLLCERSSQNKNYQDNYKQSVSNCQAR